MTMRNEADEASVTYIDADGTPIEAPSGLDADAGRTGSGAGARGGPAGWGGANSLVRPPARRR